MGLPRATFQILRTMLVALTGRGYDRSGWLNTLHHKLSYRLFRLFPLFGLRGVQTLKPRQLEGLRLSMYSEDGGVAHKFLMYGEYEPFEANVISSLIRPGDTVYNVGANIGFYTLLCSRLVGSSGRVVAFEPEPRNFALLKQNVEQNQLTNVTLYNTAAGESDGTVTLYTSPTNYGDHHLTARVSDACDGLSVGMVRLSQVAVTTPPHVMIVDVQGAELMVMEGLAEWLASTPNSLRAVAMEVSPKAIRDAGGEPERLMELLASVGSNLYLIDERRRAAIAVTPQEALLAAERRGEADVLVLREVIPPVAW